MMGQITTCGKKRRLTVFITTISRYHFRTFKRCMQECIILIVEGETVNGLPDGQIVDSIANPAANHSGGWGFNFNATDGTVTLGAIFGNATGDVVQPQDVLAFSQGQ